MVDWAGLNVQVFHGEKAYEMAEEQYHEVEEGPPVDEIAKLIQAFPKRTQRIVRMRFGFDGGGPMTLQRVGDRVGVTKERVRQIANVALDHIRDRMLSKGIVPKSRSIT